MAFARQLQLRDGQQLADKRRQQTKCRRKRALAGGSPTGLLLSTGVDSHRAISAPERPADPTALLRRVGHELPIEHRFRQRRNPTARLPPRLHAGPQVLGLGFSDFSPRPLAQRGKIPTQSSNQRNTFRCASERTILRMPGPRIQVNELNGKFAGCGGAELVKAVGKASHEMRTSFAITAWPSDNPPSFGGTW